MHTRAKPVRAGHPLPSRYAGAMTARTPPGWYVISLRPRGEHAPLRRAAARVGAGVIALSPWRLRMYSDDTTRRALREALHAPRVLFTSPVAVRAARALSPLRAREGQPWFAVGAGTAAALRRAGVTHVQAPARMDSEGLLSLPGLAHGGGDLGFVTAPGGRGLLVPELQARGFRVLRVDVYEREPVPLPPRAIAQLMVADAPLKLALSSAEALQLAMAALPDEARERLRRAQVLAASERLAELARTHGFDDIVVARSARPADLVVAATP